VGIGLKGSQRGQEAREKAKTSQDECSSWLVFRTYGFPLLSLIPCCRFRGVRFATPPSLTIPFALSPVERDGDGPRNHPSSQVPIAGIATVVIELSRGSSAGGSREERRVALGKMNHDFHRGSVS
jgi:hypothetical protein